MSIPTAAVTAARPADRADVVATLAEAFQDDPVFAWLTPDPARRSIQLPGFFALAADAVAHHDATWRAGNAGAALWTAPGQPPMTEQQGEWFGARCAEIAGPDVERWFGLIELLEAHHPDGPDHHYLWFLGVRPGEQRRGHGTALLRAVLDEADRTATPAYLDATSEDNRRLYARHGFVVTAELAVAGGPPLWAMWREPGR
jgi:ribosomal protein S18 acetylase RimI-like enzyme